VPTLTPEDRERISWLLGLDDDQHTALHVTGLTPGLISLSTAEPRRPSLHLAKDTPDELVDAIEITANDLIDALRGGGDGQSIKSLARQLSSICERVE
jgi:hypothetical protein